MKKWLPYLIAAAVGVAIAVFMFMPTTSTPKKEEVAREPTVSRTTTTSSGEPMSAIEKLEARDPAKASPEPPPPPGTLRPMNQAEIEQQAREARPFNAHTNRVQSYWLQASKELSAVDADLAREAQGMMMYVREQSRLNDSELTLEEVIAKELALEKKIRERGFDNTKLTGILDYINSSANAVIQNGDPTKIPTPSQAAAGATGG
jgi:hypothetical protein